MDSHEVNFDASAFNSGVYFYRIEANGIDGTNFTNVKKMILPSKIGRLNFALRV